MKLLIISFLIVFGLSACSMSRNSLMSSLEKEIALSSSEVNYTTINTKQFEISMPSIDNARFNSELKQQIAKDTSLLDCIGDIKVNYRVNAASDNFLSLTKEIEMLFCENYPSDIVYSETLNYLINNDSLYLISLKSTNSFSNKITPEQQKYSCSGEFMESKNQLYFNPSKMKILVWFDKSCYYSVQVPMDESELIFKAIDK